MNAIRKRVKQKDTSNLIEMVENPNRFQEVFVEAAIEELLERNANIDTDDAVLYLKKRKEVAEMLEEERQSVKVPYNLLHENIKNAI